MRGDFSRLIFIDSSVNTVGDHAKVLLPSRSFSVQGNERMSLTLQSFGIRRNWYNINPTNNTGYLSVTPTGGTEVLYEFSISPGAYATFTSLATAINAALNDTIVTHSITQLGSFTTAYNSTSRLFTISCTKTSPAALQIKCFAIKGVPPSGVSLQGGFSDIHEIIGGLPLRAANETGGSLTLTSGTAATTQVFSSKYPASLNTLDAIYIHLPGLETGNFMSTGHESHIVDSLRLVESSLFARIPFDDSSFTEVHEVIQYNSDEGDSFQSFLTRKSLESIDIRVQPFMGGRHD